jgi:hypothetical protein
MKSLSDQSYGKDYLTYSNSFDRLSFSPFTQSDNNNNDRCDNNYNIGISDYNVNEMITSYEIDNSIQRPIERVKQGESSD